MRDWLATFHFYLLLSLSLFTASGSTGDFDYESSTAGFQKDAPETNGDGDIEKVLFTDDYDGDGEDGNSGSYTKNDFFDNISSDATDRLEGVDNRLRGAAERSLNTETFGAASLGNNRRSGGPGRGRRYNNNNRSRGGGRGGSRGGGGGGRGRGGGRSGPRPQNQRWKEDSGSGSRYDRNRNGHGNNLQERSSFTKVGGDN